MNTFYFKLLCLAFFISSATCYSQKPEDTEVWEPEPKVITPGKVDRQAPSDALVLFDGKDLSQWEGSDGQPAAWKVDDGAFTVVKGTGGIKTKVPFGSVQLHIEWRSPAKVQGEGQGRGNSGVFLQERYEIQVLDSYNNRTYSNGQAASVYKQHIPMVNACRPPGAWQSYDIIFKAPKFKDQELVEPAYVTLFHNGVLVQDHVELQGISVNSGQPKYQAHPPKLPLSLQDHSNPVSFRNIWVRELD